jgi:hypothetical protein
MTTFAPHPIPVTTPLGDGYILYITPGGMYENDEITVVLLKGGEIRHFESSQVRVWVNSTYGIHE